jgi:hypothetical protein
MFEFLSNPENAINVLKKDHDKVKHLFEEFEDAETRGEKRKIAAQIIMELKIHATIEEEIFYPAVRREIGKDIMNEADEEHHVAKVLVAELDAMDGSEDHYDAKMHVLAENIRHHIREEEGEMMPEVRELNLDLNALGKELMIRKKELMKHGVPMNAEEKMIKLVHNSADSPAATAQRKRGAVKSGMKRKPLRIVTGKKKTKAGFSGSSRKMKTARRKMPGRKSR